MTQAVNLQRASLFAAMEGGLLCQPDHRAPTWPPSSALSPPVNPVKFLLILSKTILFKVGGTNKRRKQLPGISENEFFVKYRNLLGSRRTIPWHLLGFCIEGVLKRQKLA